MEFLKIRYRGSTIATTFREIPLDDSRFEQKAKNQININIGKFYKPRVTNYEPVDRSIRCKIVRTVHATKVDYRVKGPMPYYGGRTRYLFFTLQGTFFNDASKSRGTSKTELTSTITKYTWYINSVIIITKLRRIYIKRSDSFQYWKYGCPFLKSSRHFRFHDTNSRYILLFEMYRRCYLNILERDTATRSVLGAEHRIGSKADL